jgi:MFS family permease
MVLGVSFFAALASRLGKQAEFVVAGGILSTAGALVAMLNPSLITIGVLLVMLGIGQSMAIASQSALVVETATRVGGQRFAGAVGLFRVVERIGNAAGPAAAGMLFAGFGFPVAIAVVGLIGAAGPLAYGMSGHKAVISGARSVPRDKALEGS